MLALTEWASICSPPLGLRGAELEVRVAFKRKLDAKGQMVHAMCGGLNLHQCKTVQMNCLSGRADGPSEPNDHRPAKLHIALRPPSSWCSHASRLRIIGDLWVWTGRPCSVLLVSFSCASHFRRQASVTPHWHTQVGSHAALHSAWWSFEIGSLCAMHLACAFLDPSPSYDGNATA